MNLSIFFFNVATDQGLASHKSKKLKTADKGKNVNDESKRPKTTQKGRNVNYKSKELQTTEKGKNVKALFLDRIESSSKQPMRTTMKPNLEKRKPSYISNKSHPILLD